jgi:hypothetical protein
MSESSLRIAESMLDIFAPKNAWFVDEEEIEIQFEAELQYFYTFVHLPMWQNDFRSFFRVVDELETLYCVVQDEIEKLPRSQYLFALGMLREKITYEIVCHFKDLCKKEKKNVSRTTHKKMRKAVSQLLFTIWGRTDVF